MLFHQFHTEGLSINSYLIADEVTKQAVVIDPTRDVEQYIEFAKNRDLQITDIAETHVHADFVSGSKELKNKLKNLPKIHCSALGGPEWTPSYADRKISNGDTIILGEVNLQAFHTPGHTPEHIIWACNNHRNGKKGPKKLLTGDLLFVGSVGRPDLLGRDAETNLSRQLYDSLFNVLKQFEDDIEVYPAHGAGSLCGKGISDKLSSTLGQERKSNPFLKEKSEEQWIADLPRDISAAPMNFKRIKRINVEGPPLLPANLISQGVERLLIDTRDFESYAKEHFKGSINIPFGKAFANWVSSILDDDLPLGVVVDYSEKSAEIIRNLHHIGFDTIVNVIEWPANTEKRIKEKLPLIDVTDSTILDKNTFVVDVRTPAEWASGHIPGAHHIELSLLKNQLTDIPKNKNIATICGGGSRSSIAASLLKKNGFPNVSNIRGGMSAWKKSNLPLATS